MPAGRTTPRSDSDQREHLRPPRGSQAPAAHPSRTAGRPARNGNRPRTVIPVLASPSPPPALP